MVPRDRVFALAVVVGVVVAVLVISPGIGYRLGGGPPSEYDTATATLSDANGTRLATVRVRIADTPTKRYVGLSETRTLADGEGMLFVHSREATHTYVMRNMSFPLDIVFVDDTQTVTTIHHATVPPPDTDESDLRRYSGLARYVLEVPRGYTNRTGLDEGDRVDIPPSV